ncbi:FAD-dependent 5-carboxymethylaminomethyl-2-thiouridine(34) oxidoreductase MnmC [Aliidiomarina sanyensis]|uniref:tRNA 5-methylaminomethyl-2-thiouridine biosynthesis bifunctional protein MnmC n=1 Tax=Aliidiomarina sanyensis TaxID=1249555 RepID=A0A432WDL3_9GAMM|nr:FAD-dependent 5-carboxymethylaminomethyl-2-thiouridine(34) oxidoreductase MnmC [Aliidiomarina sanyensis]RUO30488.1 hypothetical protein CWE11_08935 [Aliidiomarina sanyensis]
MFRPNVSTPISYANVRFDATGTPESEGFGDIYFTRAQGIAESRYVFLSGNQLASRFRHHQSTQPFVIAETGFGTGLNVLLASALFLQEAPADALLHFVSVERYPLRPEDLERALETLVAVEPSLQPFIEPLCAGYPPPIQGTHRIVLHDRITLDLIFDDVLTAIPAWSERHPNQVDAWFLDGFAPQKNPDMWRSALYRAIAISLKNQGSLATFTAVGAVRRGLQNVGISMQKVPGFGTKREMLVGQKQVLAVPHKSTSPKPLLIIGSGIAAANLAWSLRHYPGPLCLWADSKPGQAASGNPQGAVYPLLQAQWTPTSAFYSAAFLFARARYQQITPQYAHFDGLLEYAKNQSSSAAHDYQRMRKLKGLALYPSALFDLITSEQAIAKTNINPGVGASVHPHAGWIEAAAVVRTILSQVQTFRRERALPWETRWDVTVDHVEPIAHGCRIHDKQGSPTDFSTVVLACGDQVSTLLPDVDLPIRPVRGQITQLRVDTPALAQLQYVLCRGGYATPPINGSLCIGATFDKTRRTAEYDAADDVENLRQFNAQFSLQVSQDAIQGGRAGVRATTPDHLPLIGLIENVASGTQRLKTHQGLYVLTGFGARGLTSAPLAAEAVASMIQGKPSPLTCGLEAYLSPMRFKRRARERGNASSRKRER